MNRKIIILVAVIAVLVSVESFFSKPPSDSFNAPGNNYQSPKKIEDYFVGTLKMQPDEAKKFADVGVSFYVTKNTTLKAITSNLAYYGLVKDENALNYALEHTKDTTPGNTDSVKVGSNGTIDLAYFGLSRNMDAWQIADALLNNPHPVGVEYGYLFMPGDPNALYGPRPEK